MKRILTFLAIWMASALTCVSALGQDFHRDDTNPAENENIKIIDADRPWRGGTNFVGAEGEHHIIDIFRPVYLCTGFQPGEKISGQTADIKFQYSVRASLFRDLWGLKFDFFIGFTQRSFWNIYAYSSPIYDNTYMPGIYTYFPITNKATGKVTNDILYGYEHRSNGRDDLLSRSVNYGFVTYTHYFPCNLNLQATLRFGDGYYGDTRTWEVMNRYFGYVNLSAMYTTPKKTFDFMVNVAPIYNRNIANITAEASVRLSRKYGNPYFFVQYHRGYDDACRDILTDIPDVVGPDGMVHMNNGMPKAPKQYIRFGVMFQPRTMMRGFL